MSFSILGSLGEENILLFSAMALLLGPPLCPESVASSEANLNTQGVVQRLTDQKWRSISTRQHGLSTEVTSWELFSDGTFRWRFTSDYVQSSVGVWSAKVVSKRQGLLFFATVESNNQLSSVSSVLSFTFQTERLRMGERLYQGTAFTHQDVPPPLPEATHVRVSSKQREKEFSLWTVLTGSNWQSQSGHTAGVPNAYTFEKDGSYSARFSATQCMYKGTWSLVTSRNNAGEIRLTVPSNDCDPRGWRNLYIRRMTITLKGTEVSMDGTVYVSHTKIH